MSQTQSVPTSLPELRERAEQEQYDVLTKHCSLLGALIKERNELRSFDKHATDKRGAIVERLRTARAALDEFEAGRAQS